MAKTSTTSSDSRRIKFNIPHVTASTKLSTLTVGQFVELLVQVTPQLPVARSAPNAQALKKAFEQFQQIVGTAKSGSVLDDMIRQTQHTIIEKMPQLIEQMTHRPKDGGPSPFVKGSAGSS